MPITGNDLSLYFHIPFCTKKCDYCHFYVLPDKDSLKETLLQALEIEWQLRLPEIAGKEITSIYFGGGTPALFGPERIARILNWIPYRGNIEITLEANPENITLEQMQGYAEAGINRVSIGIQSLNDSLLLSLGRTHNAGKAEEAVYLTKKAGIANISIDLMYDLPSQSLDDWKETLGKVAPLPITHLSLYNLTIEPHTQFFKRKDELAKRVPDAETSLQMYLTALAALEERGLTQYEISAFAKVGFQSHHNLGYWTARSFLGFGPSAFSYLKGSRFRNVAHLNRYSAALHEGKFPVDFEEQLEPEARERELFAIRLRLLEGVDLRFFPLLQKDVHFQKQLSELSKEGLLIVAGTHYSLAKRGILFYDTVAAELI